MAKYRFRLLEGQHIEADRSKPVLGLDSKPTGRFERRVFKKGEFIDTDTDLAAKLGANKFELTTRGHATQAEEIAELEGRLAALKAQQAGGRTSGDPSPEVAAGSPSVAPGGQVSTGFQKSVGPHGSAPMTPAEAAGHGASVPKDVLAASREAESEGGKARRQAKAQEEDLDSLTVVELRDLAAEEEIELHGARTKDEIQSAIRKGRRK